MAELLRKSKRFTNAARAERDRLARRRSMIFQQRDDLQKKIDQLDEELEVVDEEITVLEGLAGTEKTLGAVPELRDSSLLSGAAIRTFAVPLLLRERGSAPIHYRDWFSLLGEAGYGVGGKRPDAVFLNQVVRSPLVRATTRAGYYELDLGVVDRLRAELSQLQRKLAVSIDGEAGVDALEDQRRRQREINKEIAKAQRELEEALAAIEAAGEGTDSTLTRAHAA